MDKIYDQLTAKSFKKASTAILIFIDALVVVYMYIRFSNKELYNAVLGQVLKAMPQAQGSLPANFRDELYHLMINSLMTMLCILVIYHLLVYFLWWKDKPFSRGYINLYVWVGGPLSGLALLTNLDAGLASVAFFALLTAGFLFIAFGMSRFETIEKKKISSSKSQE